MEISKLMGEMSKSKDQSQYSEEVCDELEEYFRLKFRKMSFDEAKGIVMSIGDRDGGAS